MSQTELQDHLAETHGETQPHSQEQMIEDEMAEWFGERQRKKKKKKKKKKQDFDDEDEDDDEDKDEMYFLSQDYGDDSNVDPEYCPSNKELRQADDEGDM